MQNCYKRWMIFISLNKNIIIINKNNYIRTSKSVENKVLVRSLLITIKRIKKINFKKKGKLK